VKRSEADPPLPVKSATILAARPAAIRACSGRSSDEAPCIDFIDLNEYVSFSKNALELLKSAAGLLPKGEDRDRAEVALKAATDALARSDAKLANELGFRLCQCSFPGEPMLWKKDIRKHVCGKCGDAYAFEHPKLDEYEDDWVAARR
jgi:hypothetical protein